MSEWAQGTVVVLGAGGMLACELIPRMQEQTRSAGGKVLVWTKGELDITDRKLVLEQIGLATPSVVINCAAYTDVDGCESNTAKAMKVNGEGPGYLAEACKAASALFVHFSTDFVFDGELRRPYRVDDEAHPLSAYGISKLEGERAIISRDCTFLIIRTSWLYGSHGRNFVEAILGKAERDEQLKVVSDQVGRPTYAPDLSDAAMRLLEAQAGGIIHFANSGHCSWHEFAVEIIRQSGLRVPVGTLSSSELGRPAKRPAYSVLDMSSYEKAASATPRHWKDALADFMRLRKSTGQVV